MLTDKDKKVILRQYGAGKKTVNLFARDYGVDVTEIRTLLTGAGFVLVGRDAGKKSVATIFNSSAAKGRGKDMITPAEANRLMALWGRP